MTHQCVRCAKQYDNNAPELLAGCSCGGRVFLFIREHEPATPEKGSVMGGGKSVNGVTHLGGGYSSAGGRIAAGGNISKGVSSVADLTPEQKARIEREVAPLAKEKPLSIQLEAENIRILTKGHYVLDLKSLFAGEPIVIKNAKGVYYVRFPRKTTNERR